MLITNIKHCLCNQSMLSRLLYHSGEVLGYLDIEVDQYLELLTL